jgi:signal transduction histidine kinase
MPTDDTRKYQDRFRALSRLVESAAAGTPAEDLLNLATSEAVATIGLLAGSVRIFGPEDVDLVGAVAGDVKGRKRIQELERTLLADLRRNYAVRSLYMTLDLDGPSGLFSYPLRSGDKVIGTISGIARGERNLAVEEEFVAAVASMIVLAGRTGDPWASGSEPPAGKLSPGEETQIKTRAVIEAAATLNHEINNPLMAVVGNLELLLRHADKLEPDAVAKLHKIRDAAERIRTVTQDLMRLREARSIPYPGGGRMIDLDGSPKEGDS